MADCVKASRIGLVGLSMEAQHGNLGSPQEVLWASNANVSKSQAGKFMKQPDVPQYRMVETMAVRACMTQVQALRIEFSRNTVPPNISCLSCS